MAAINNSLNDAQLTSLKASLAKRESGGAGDTNAENTVGYLGRYQFGAAALEDTGYLKPGSYKKYGQSALKSSSNWTGKNGATSKTTFLGNEPAQENAMDSLLNQNYKTGIRSNVIKSGISDSEVGGYLAASHIGGAGNANAYYRDGTAFADAYGTGINEYARLGEASIDSSLTPSTSSSSQVAADSNDATLVQNQDGRFGRSNANPTVIKDPDFSGVQNQGVQGHKQNADKGEGTANRQSQGTGNTATTIQADNARIAKAFLEKIETKENKFKKFATMTYSASVYLLPMSRYKQLVTEGDGKRTVAGLPLLFQSAGIHNKEALYGAKRAKHFDKDFYIDDIEMKGLVSGTATQSVHNQYAMSFKITEPNGLSFLDRLTAQVRDDFESNVKDERNIPYASQCYLMVLRFYGYDIEGNIVDANLDADKVNSDEKSYAEKFIPFLFTGIKFGIEDAIVSYQCDAVCPQSHYGTVSTYTQTSEEINLTGDTVGELLSSQKSSNPSLVQRLNHHSNKIANGKKIQEIPNEYEIIFEKESGIELEPVTRYGRINKHLVGMGNKSTTPKEKNDPKAGKVDKTSRIITIPQGTPIVKVIETIVRNSEFVTKQQEILGDKNGELKLREKTGDKYFNWFKVRMQTEPLEFDEQRRDYAYKITYVVSLYGTGDLKSPVFPGAYYRGVHKRYPYWFTGENTEVLNLSAEFNYLYFQQITPNMPSDLKLPIINANEVIQYYYQPRANEDSNAGDDKSAELAASAASILYSPADQAQVEVEIIGDIDWIAQSEIFYSPTYSLESTGYDPFMPDGSMNFDASEVYFSIEYNTASDYGPEGLLTERYESPYLNKSAPDAVSHNAVNLVYRANEIYTYLKEGEFTQKLKGTLMFWRDDGTAVKDEQGNLTIYEKSVKQKKPAKQNIAQTAQETEIAQSQTDD